MLLVLLLVLLLSTRKIGSHDLGFHLKGGEWIVQHHSVPRTDSFTYTLNDREYLDSHWLYEVLLYAVWKALDYQGLNLLHSAVLLVLFFLLAHRLKLAGASDGQVCLLLLGTLLLCERRFSLRPEVLSWLFLTGTLWVLDLREMGRNLLWVLPLIQLFWVNSEALFMLGWFVTGVYALQGRLREDRWDPALLKYGGLSVAAGFLNPYLLQGLLFPIKLLWRHAGDDPQKMTIAEFQSPWSYLRILKDTHDLNLNIYLFFLVALLGLGMLLWRPGRRNRAREILLWLAFGALAGSMVRNIPLFGLVAFPILAGILKDLPWPPLRWRAWNGSAAGLLALFLILFCLRVATDAYYTLDRRSDRFGWGIDPTQLPLRAADFLRDNGLDGRILNYMGFGGWLDWRGPQPTFMDGRLEVPDAAFYEEYSQASRPGGLAFLIGKYRPRLILTEFNATYPWFEQLKYLPDWRTIYLDECTAIYARSDYAKEFPFLTFQGLLEARKVPRLSDEEGAALLASIPPTSFHAWLRGFVQRQDYPMGLMSMGLYALRAGDPMAARDLFAESLRRAGGGYAEIYFNLGVAYLRLNNLPLGRTCLRYTLALDPDNPSAKKMFDGFLNLEKRQQELMEEMGRNHQPPGP